jgi:NAD(P) transhydrogenase subunit alpha
VERHARPAHAPDGGDQRHLLAAAAHGAAGQGISAHVWISKGAGAVAAGLAAVNIFGGFLVTQRMLAMYKKKDKAK